MCVSSSTWPINFTDYIRQQIYTHTHTHSHDGCKTSIDGARVLLLRVDGGGGCVFFLYPMRRARNNATQNAVRFQWRRQTALTTTVAVNSSPSRVVVVVASSSSSRCAFYNVKTYYESHLFMRRERFDFFPPLFPAYPIS